MVVLTDREDAVVGAVACQFDDQAARGFLVAPVGEEQTAAVGRPVGLADVGGAEAMYL